MTTSSEHMHQIPHRPAGRVSLDELARCKGVCPVESMDELANVLVLPTTTTSKMSPGPGAVTICLAQGRAARRTP
jgi:hypothetical protein